jgi:hypothetical protein
LLIAYPDDQRLIKAKALIEGLLASGDPTSAAPGNPGVAQPLADGNAERLSGMEKVEFNSLLQLARQAQQETAPEQQTALLRQFVSQSDAFLQRHPDQMLLWQLRAVAALGLHDPYAQYIGFQAGQKLIAAGAASSNDPNLQQLLSRLNLMGWLDGQKMEEATKNTADSLTNGMGTKFARVPGTTTVFSIYLTKVGAFQAFVDETHYDATQGMQAAVPGHQGATLLASYVQAHYESLGGSWQDPAFGYRQTPDSAVIGISWEDAEAFCQWLTEKERRYGKIRIDQRYRLPTDAEWSLAVRLSDEQGETPEAKSGRVKTRLSNWRDSNTPNEYGLYWLAGYESQHCEDWYNAKHVDKVSRGGSWFFDDPRASYRRAIGPTTRANDFGFRVVLANDTDDKQGVTQR